MIKPAHALMAPVLGLATALALAAGSESSRPITDAAMLEPAIASIDAPAARALASRLGGTLYVDERPVTGLPFQALRMSRPSPIRGAHQDG